ncbi:glutamate receptor ionotropic, delta-2-like isoform X1 [Apis laboriosa]|uniref:glutamate receptor ionotropic, delta-2-like isoform X1 n=2 Tax=Apis laboriosa TaxID=183418 RepID=UPI001CC33FD5|nr:glutamate receptor ionotropic, delta-2-like isoform X1 [Apis laboriosa]XP_043797420.1 glutamate receptor ionotropic, delta-2-like isoform X1 [Apis laboriosa]
MKTKFFVLPFYMATSACILPSPLILQLILEFAKWKTWDQIVLFENLTSLDCVFTYTRPLIACLSDEGIGMSIQSATNPNIPDALTIQKHRIGSIVLLDGLNLTAPDNILYVASQKFQFNYYVSWLMITMRNMDTTIDTVLRHLNIGIDSDVIVATPSTTYEMIQKLSRIYWNKTCASLQHYGNHFDFREPPIKHFDENASINLNYAVLENGTLLFYFIHVYKIRYSDNTSLVTNFLGSWNLDSWSLNNPISVKLRNEFKGQPIIFGILNGTIDGQIDVNEEEMNDIAPFLDFASFVVNSVNASIELVPHEKLGTLNNKVWSNLLGDVVNGEVDIGLGYITVNKERQAEMSFSHPLIRYMRNIYYHPLESGTMRDIFRQPFNNCLLSCVAFTYFVILISLGLIIYTAKIVLHYEEAKSVGIGEAALWCISIMCMQGSPWTPCNPSGKIILLFTLIFALVMYNAYAGFITSILSVQASGIKSITDILSHNFKLGYSITDDEYIRNVNDSNLRQLYIRAYNSRESKLDTSSGLTKAVKGHYGFFVSATLARRTLRSTLIQERCTLKELPLPQTFTMVALPMANSCPYKKIINLNILKIRERGVLNRITEQMLPEMPRCKSSTTFHSARLADVYSAFFILIAGGMVAISIWIVERIWHKRRQMKETIVRRVRQRRLMPSHLSYLPRFKSFSHFPFQSQLHSYNDHRSEFSHDYDCKHNSSINNDCLASKLSISTKHSREEISLKKRKEKNDYIDSDENIDRSRYESKFFTWKRYSNLKRANWNQFSEFPRSKLDKNKIDRLKDNIIFPFHH